WGLLVGLAGLATLSLAPQLAGTLAAPAYWIAAGALLGASRRTGAGGDWRRLGWGLALGGALLLAFRLRWGFLVETPGWALPLSMDAQSYFDEALYLDRLLLDRRTNLLALFYSGATYFREPLYIYLMHGWLKLVGPQEIHTVFLTVLASVAWIGVSTFAVSLLLNRWAGLLTAFLLAIDAIWYRNAAVGLREEVTGTLLGLTVIALWAGWARQSGLPGGRAEGRPGWQESGWPVWVAPVLAGGAAIIRLDALPLALFLLLWAAVAQRWRVWRAGLVLLLFVAVVVPPLAGHARSRGDAAPASTEIATNNWREVFKDRLGEPGFEADRRVSASEFLFRYFTPAQLVAYTARGYARIYGEEVFESHYYLLAGLSGAWGGAVGLHRPWLFPLLFLAGTGGILLRRQHWRRMWLVPAICVVGVLPPIGFVAGVPGHPELYQARYAYQVAPYATATVAWALVTGGIWVAGRAGRVVRPGALRSAVRPPREARSDLALRRGA
ncbi:MAG TPA: hypothetical protein VH257_22380, partial [Chloroflexota bacterium]|nr:hypothetical protein [Chloroflexota bacterium]